MFTSAPRLQPSYSHILGSFSAAGISNLYKSPQDRQVGLTLRNGLIITAAAAGVNVMREFLFRDPSAVWQRCYVHFHAMRRVCVSTLSNFF
ncbi:MAG: hypothetical protein ACJ746_26090 [Bryobacteraceae bacterium]